MPRLLPTKPCLGMLLFLPISPEAGSLEMKRVTEELGEMRQVTDSFIPDA